MNRRTVIVWSSLLIVWAVVAGWQVAEHLRVRQATRTQVVNRARDISTTLALVLRSQRRFGIISRERLESAINELIRPGEVDAIALLNTDGEVVASAGHEQEWLQTWLASETLHAGVHWGRDAVTVVNLVDLGTNTVPREAEGQPAQPLPTLILPRGEITNRFPPPPPGSFPPGPPPEGFTNLLSSATNGSLTNAPRGNRWRWMFGTNAGTVAPTNFPGFGTNRPAFGRPFWMTDAEYRNALKKQGAHSILIAMSGEALRSTVSRDLWLRGFVCALAAAAASLAGFTWRNVSKTHDLQLRLVKASEMNGHLKQMNLAAAGLAHETRNPLNIIRGLAQLISKDTAVSADIRQRARGITDETDRVTAQLNEFINYARPREVRRVPVAVGTVASEIGRTLGYDLEEKGIRLEVVDEGLTIEADEQLLRQTLFNLLLNAIQAVENGGHIQVVALRIGPEEAALEVRDDGPGVPAEQRSEIFKPYVTTHQRGTGLGLAVVQQIVAAHGWEIVCLANTPKGAVFRISRLRISRNS